MEDNLRNFIESQLKTCNGKPVSVVVVQYANARDASVPTEKVRNWEAYLEQYRSSIDIMREYGVDVFEVAFHCADYARWLKDKGFVDTRAVRAMWAQTRI